MNQSTHEPTHQNLSTGAPKQPENGIKGDVMWPHMGSTGWWMWWMPFGWVLGLAVLVLLVWMIARTAGGFPGPAGESPEQIIKRRYAKGEIDREEYDRRLSDIRR